jgi:excinuclease ABC subunit C
MDPKDQAAQLPESPGVYLFKDAGGHVIYVGKARAQRPTPVSLMRDYDCGCGCFR